MPIPNINYSNSLLTAKAEGNISGVSAFSTQSRVILLRELIGAALLGTAYHLNRRGVSAN